MNLCSHSSLSLHNCSDSILLRKMQKDTSYQRYLLPPQVSASKTSCPEFHFSLHISLIKQNLTQPSHPLHCSVQAQVNLFTSQSPCCEGHQEEQKLIVEDLLFQEYFRVSTTVTFIVWTFLNDNCCEERSDQKLCSRVWAISTRYSTKSARSEVQGA